ncbi:MAG: ABC transporter permease, partial [Gammaproteobacteria bacterium]
MKRLLHRPALLIAGSLSLLLVLVAALAPWLAPHDPLVGVLTERLTPPLWQEGGSIAYPLGTDVLGRDILSRLLYGARVSLLVCALAILLAGTVGSLLGIVAGYLGGWLESLIMRLVDLAISLPVILLALLFGVLFGPSFTNIVIVIALVLWSQYARMARGETLKVRESDYVDLARTAGCSHLRIMATHVLPNVSGALIVLATL